MTRNYLRDYPLIELVIATGVIALLATSSYPKVEGTLQMGRRAQARAAVEELMREQERYFAQHGCYLGFTTSDAGVATASAPFPPGACGGVTAPSVPFKVFSDESLATSAYLLSADACPSSGGTGQAQSIAECVRVSATPIKPDLKAGTIQLTSTGTRTCTGTERSVCW